MRRAETVGPGVAATDDDDLLVLGGDRRLAIRADHVIALLDPVGPGQKLHRLVDPVEFTTGDRQVARRGRTAGKDDGVVVQPQLRDGDVDADVDARPELGALGLHLRQPPVDVALLHLELGDAVPQQAADAVGPLEHGHGVACTGELLRGGQPGRTGAHDGDLFARQLVRRQRNDPTLVEGVVDDLDLDLLDGHRILVDAEHA